MECEKGLEAFEGIVKFQRPVRRWWETVSKMFKD